MFVIAPVVARQDTLPIDTDRPSAGLQPTDGGFMTGFSYHRVPETGPTPGDLGDPEPTPHRPESRLVKHTPS